MVWVEQIKENLSDAAKLNRRAAIWTAVCVFLSATATFTGNFHF
jgi:hypothetical protein